jgi:hypothetical protein
VAHRAELIGRGQCTGCRMIGVAQRVEHYEMAGYGTARALAQKVGHNDIADILGETLEEERATDAKLAEMREDELRDLGVESDDLALGEAAFRKVDLVEIRDRQLAAVDFEELLLLRGHGAACAELLAGPATMSMAGRSLGLPRAAWKPAA